MTRRALLFVNERSGRVRADVRTIVERLAGGGVTVDSRPIPSRGDVAELVRQQEGAIDMVLAGGGDGTLNAVLQPVMQTELPLGVLPLGTANVFARSVDVGASIDVAVNAILSGHQRAVDVGRVNGVYFLNVASLGLTVSMTERLSKAAKRRWGLLAYGPAAVRVLSKVRPFGVTITTPGKTVRTSTLQISVANGRYYGGGLPLLGESALDDASLDILSLEVRHWWDLFLLLPSIRSAKGPDCGVLRCLTGPMFDISTRPSRPIDTDGEVTTSTPAHFEVLPEALRVFAPLAA